MLRMTKPLKVTFDEAADAAYIYLTEIQAGAVKKTHCCYPLDVGEMVNLDFDADGRLVGIEILGAKKKLPIELLSASGDQ